MFLDINEQLLKRLNWLSLLFFPAVWFLCVKYVPLVAEDRRKGLLILIFGIPVMLSLIAVKRVGYRWIFFTLLWAAAIFRFMLLPA
jgi:hypothetical protein